MRRIVTEVLEWALVMAATVACVLINAATASADTPTSAPTSQATSAATTETATPAAWPPGLMQEGLDAVTKTKLEDDPWRFKVYGFVEGSFTGRLTGGQSPLPLRVFDARHPNDARLNQLVLTAERTYDPTKAIDFGGRIDGMFGGDARALKNAPWGMFPYSGESDGGDAWVDMVQAYGQMWLKTGDGSGLETTVGKFLTPIGYEYVYAWQNQLFSHSYLFLAAPFTNTGVKLNYIWNSNLSTYFAIVEGWDVWHDNNHAVSYMTGVAWTSTAQVGGKSVDAAYFNFITGPEQNGRVNNYRTLFDASYVHNWTDKLQEAVNADLGFEPSVQVGTTDDGAPIYDDWTHWYGIAHYLQYTFNDYVTGVWRAEWFRDEDGTRTGFAGNLVENTWGVNITPWPKDKLLNTLMFRPEFRWDASCGGAAFGDDHHNQLTLGFDVIYKF